MKIIYDKADDKLFREYAKEHKVSSEVLKAYHRSSLRVDLAGDIEDILRVEDELDEQFISDMREQKLWKLQRPLFTTGGYNDILAYEVDDDGNEVKNGTLAHIPMPKKIIKTLFHDNKFAKVYYLGEVKDGKLEISIDIPVLEDLWV